MVGIFTKHEAVFETEVTALRSLIITSPPSTVFFIPGNDPNPKWPGLAVWGEWDQLGSAKIDTASLEFSGFMKDRPGKQTVTVSYEGASAAFGVEVMALTGIEMVNPPRKTDYMLGDAIDLTALEVYGNYTSSNHNTERLFVPTERFTLSGFDSQSAGMRQKVTATVMGRSVSFFVNVAIKWPTELWGNWVKESDKSLSCYIYPEGMYLSGTGKTWNLYSLTRNTYTVNSFNSVTTYSFSAGINQTGSTSTYPVFFYGSVSGNRLNITISNSTYVDIVNGTYTRR
jgi:hypothetical protein